MPLSGLPGGATSVPEALIKYELSESGDDSQEAGVRSCPTSPRVNKEYMEGR